MYTILLLKFYTEYNAYFIFLSFSFMINKYSMTIIFKGYVVFHQVIFFFPTVWLANSPFRIAFQKWALDIWIQILV